MPRGVGPRRKPLKKDVVALRGTPSQVGVLLWSVYTVLATEGARSSSEVGARLAIDRCTASRAISRLLRTGRVERVPIKIARRRCGTWKESGNQRKYRALPDIDAIAVCECCHAAPRAKIGPYCSSCRQVLRHDLVRVRAALARIEEVTATGRDPSSTIYALSSALQIPLWDYDDETTHSRRAGLVSAALAHELLDDSWRERAFEAQGKSPFTTPSSLSDRGKTQKRRGRMDDAEEDKDVEEGTSDDDDD